MSLMDALKNVASDKLRYISIHDLNSYALRNRDAIKICYDNGIIDDSSIEEDLQEAVFKQALNDFDWMTMIKQREVTYADHVACPACLAYALEKKMFSKKQIKQIPFDHGQTAETYVKQYGKKNLFSVLRKKLLNPTSSLVGEMHDLELCGE